MHIMLDLETWGRTPGSDIRSIGAVVFDPVAPYGGFVGMRCTACINGATDPWGCTDCLNTGKDMRGEFYIACDNPAGRWRNGEFVPELATGAEDYRLYPLTREPETVQWWNDQSEEAQAAFANPVDLRDALIEFGNWFNEISPATPPMEIRIWANDPHFDVSILGAAYRAVQLPEPWHYRAPRSMKTIVEAAGMTRDDYSNHGTAHNALDDAIAQAMTVCEAYKRLGLQK
ncbi:endodeoxyribonuclease protein [Rhizobium phage RHph_X2_24]|nr:endodeoxyribonuclease protein [Rhizobium phage RHph_X2_24]